MELVVRDLPTLTGQLGKSERIVSDRCTFDTRVAVASKANVGTNGKVTVMLRITEDTLVTSRLNAIAAKFPSPTEEQLTAAILVCGVNSTSMPAGAYTPDDVFSATVEVRTRIPQATDTINGTPVISKYHDACRILGVKVEDYPQIYMYVVTRRALVADVKTAFGGNPWSKQTNTPPTTTFTFDEVEAQLSGAQLRKLFNLAANASAAKLNEAKTAAINAGKVFTENEVNAAKAQDVPF